MRVSSHQDGRPPLDATTLAEAPGWTSVEVVDETGSTNADVARRAMAGAPHGLVVVTEHQTAGRGRLGRTWETPPRAALTFSVLVRPGAAAAGSPWPLLPLLTGVAVVDGIAAAGGPACGLKWPNDILLDDLKVGGLLAERIDTPDGPAAVLGVGLNVTTTLDELPVPTASSLLVARGQAPRREAVLVCVLDRLGELLDTWTYEAPAALLTAYRERCVTLGRRVRADLPGGQSLEGTAVRVSDDGSLVVAADGGERVISAGDVVHVRAVP